MISLISIITNIVNYFISIYFTYIQSFLYPFCHCRPKILELAGRRPQLLSTISNFSVFAFKTNFKVLRYGLVGGSINCWLNCFRFWENDTCGVAFKILVEFRKKTCFHIPPLQLKPSLGDPAGLELHSPNRPASRQLAK